MIEAGERKDPSSKTLSALAGALGISLDWLIDGAGDAPEEALVRAHTARLRGELVADSEADATGTDGSNG